MTTVSDPPELHDPPDPVVRPPYHSPEGARRAELLRRSAKGEWIGAIALSEPDAGSDLAGVATRAERACDDVHGDHFVVTGQKRWTGNAKAADFISVLVRVADPGPDERRSAGLATLLVEKDRDSFPDGITGSPIDKIDYHGFVTWDLEFDGLRVPVANQVGARDTGGGFADSRSGSTSPGCTPRRGRSGSPGPPSRTASSTCRNAASSSTRSEITHRADIPTGLLLGGVAVAPVQLDPVAVTSAAISVCSIRQIDPDLRYFREQLDRKGPGQRGIPQPVPEV